MRRDAKRAPTYGLRDTHMLVVHMRRGRIVGLVGMSAGIATRFAFDEVEYQMR